MKLPTSILALRESGVLRTVDVALAEFVCRRHPSLVDVALGDGDTLAAIIEAVALAAALASRALVAGHAGIRLDRIDALLQELTGAAPDPSQERQSLEQVSAESRHSADQRVIVPSGTEWMRRLRLSPWVAVTEAASTSHHEQSDRDSSAMPDDAVVLLLSGNLVQLQRYARHEIRLADSLRARAANGVVAAAESDAAIETLLDAHFSDQDADRLPRQAARIALQSRLLILCGGPGTGKTHTVLRLLACLADARMIDASLAPQRIRLAAPTGKAASRLNDSLRERLPEVDRQGRITAALAGPATTLHRLLGLGVNGGRPRHHAGNPIDADLVIVDEVSMVDLPLMARLLDATAPDARLVLIGDRDQLASVETGDVLAALDDAAGTTESMEHERSEDDARAPLAGLRVTLSHNHRFGASSAIGQLAECIRSGDVDRARGVIATSETLQLHEGDLWSQLGALQERAVALQQALRQLSDPEAALRYMDDYRILCALRRGRVGADALNQRIDAHCAGSVGRLGQRHYPGQLILIRENQPRLGLHNGDTGVVLPNDRGELQAWFRDAQGNPRALQPALLPAHQPAWALTVHQSQGSEYRHVDIVLAEVDARVLGRQLLYTAVTRARGSLDIHAGPAVLDACVTRRLARMGGLFDRLQDSDRQRGV